MLQPNRSNFRKHLGWAIGFIVAAAVLSMFDGLVAHSFQFHYVPRDVMRVLNWAEIFGHGMGVAIILLAIFLHAPQLRRFLPRVIACALLAGTLSNIFKLAISRIRPAAIHHQLESMIGQGAPGWKLDSVSSHSSASIFQSMPSSHVATAFGLAVALSWLLPRGRRYFFALAFLVAAQRVTSLAHWASDVCVGAAVGMAVGGMITGTRFADRFYSRFEMPGKRESEWDTN